MNYDVLFTPFKIGRMEVKNRIVMSPMGTLMANRDGTFSENEIAYYEERARGGTGMIICGQGYLNSDFGQGVLGHAWDHYHVVPAARGLTERLHGYGCKAVMQLSCGTGRNANEIHGKLPISSSENTWVWDPKVKCHALTIEEIAEMMKLWEYSAGLVRDAGFDAIEVHAHVGYLVDQFLSPIWNKRTDEYGGSPENRTRFATDIVDAIHRGAGKDFPVIFRLSLDHRIPGGRTPLRIVCDTHLRTPLTAINGWGETLLELEKTGGGDSEQRRRGVHIILKESRRLTTMVEELLDFSKMEDGRFTLSIEQVDLQAEFEDAIYTYRELFKQESIELTYDGGDELFDPIPGDPERLKQVFCNVLDNAAKHGGAGKRIDAAVRGDEGRIIITVRDYGPGIPEAELPFVKQKFYKGSSKARGSGIGLAVCDEIIHLHGGTFDIGNAEGGGCLVTITLPRA